MLDEGLLIQEPNVQIGLWQRDSVLTLPGGNFFLDKPYFFAASFPDKATFIATESHGLFIWKDALVKPLPTSVDHLLKKGQIYHGYPLKNGDYALSTRRFGSFIVDKNGNVKTKIDYNYDLEGRLINPISVSVDSSGNIWIAHWANFSDIGEVTIFNSDGKFLKKISGYQKTNLLLQSVVFYVEKMKYMFLLELKGHQYQFLIYKVIS